MEGVQGTKTNMTISYRLTLLGLLKVYLLSLCTPLKLLNPLYVLMVMVLVAVVEPFVYLHSELYNLFCLQCNLNVSINNLNVLVTVGLMLLWR